MNLHYILGYLSISLSIYAAYFYTYLRKLWESRYFLGSQIKPLFTKGCQFHHEYRTVLQAVEKGVSSVVSAEAAGKVKDGVGVIQRHSLFRSSSNSIKLAGFLVGRFCRFQIGLDNANPVDSHNWDPLRHRIYLQIITHCLRNSFNRAYIQKSLWVY